MKDRHFQLRWVVLLALVLFGWYLWGHDLWAPDEPYFGEGAREMVADGEWLVPHVNGEITTDKPPLFFWLIALVSLPFGFVSSFTARLPSMLAALGSVVLTVRLGRRMGDRRTAVLAGAILATTYLFWNKARSAQIDSLLCFLILCSLTAFEGFRAGDWGGRRAGVVFWVAAGLAVLAKGPVGVLLPLGVALLTLALDRDLRSWRRFAPLVGPLLFFAVVGAWAGATLVWGGEYSVFGALREHFFDRAVHGMHHAQPVWYYLETMPVDLLPWSVLIPGALLLAWRRRRQPADRFLLAWSLFVVVFFSVSTEKRDLYILPAVPALALLFARLVGAVEGWWAASEGSEGPVPGRRWVAWPLAAFGALVVIVALLVPAAVPRFESMPRYAEVPSAPAYALAAVLLVSGIAVLWAVRRAGVLPVVLAAGGTMVATLLTLVTFVYPALEPVKSGRSLALVVRDATAEWRAEGGELLGMDLGNVPRPINFYADGIYLDLVAGTAELSERIGAGQAYLLASEESLAQLPAKLRRRMTVLYSTYHNGKDVELVRFAASPGK